MAIFSHNTCRFCEDRDQDMVRYGIRHHAHFHCYLNAGKKIGDLHPWQVRSFPYFLLKEHGLLDEAQRIIESEDAA